MANIMRWLVPKEEKFFEMLAEQSQNALEAAKELKTFVDEYPKFERSERKAKVQSIKNIEHKGDELMHKLIEKLDRSFIAPINKEGIHQMAVLIDDITELVNEAALRFILLGIERIDSYITKLVDVIVNAVSEISKSISDLKKLKHLKEHYVKIHSLENEADDIYHDALSELFHFYKNSIDIIKYKEIYELLGKITDKCEDVAQVIESIAFKHS